MKHLTQTEKDIMRFLENRDRNLLDGTVLTHSVVFIDSIQKDSLIEALHKLAKEYGFLAAA